MKKHEFSKEANVIFNSLIDRIDEYVDKTTSGNFNEATPYAFAIGALADIDNALKKIEKKRKKK